MAYDPITDLPARVNLGLADEQPPHQWRDASGVLWTEGEVAPSGNIVSEPGVHLIAGTIWIDRTNLEAAQRHGWAPITESAIGKLVKVCRGRPA